MRASSWLKWYNRLMSELKPAQSADVIKYYHDGYNAEARSNGWKDKVPLGESAIRTTLASETLLPGGQKGMLTAKEMGEGLEYLEGKNVPAIDEEELERMVDTGLFSYYAARRILEAEAASTK